MQRLVYVSESKMDDADINASVGKIVTVAQSRNPPLGVTGALIFTGTHFAQVLEGCEQAIDELMSSIYNDERHQAVWIVHRSSIIERQFPRWAMAYQGPSHFVSNHVTRLFQPRSETEHQRATGWLVELARQFVDPMKVVSRS